MNKIEEREKHPMRCADYEGTIAMYYLPTCICKFFWYDCGPKDLTGEVKGQYRILGCTCNGNIAPITLGVINHTARRGCCKFEPEVTTND